MKTWFVSAALAILMITCNASAQSKEALVGTWKLVSATDTTDRGEVKEPFGKGAIGFLTYTADGRMVAIISHGGRKPLSIPDYVGASPSERAEAFATFLSYAGTYKLEGSRLIHHVEASWLQNWVGTDQVRIVVKLQGDQLILRTQPFPRGGNTVTAELVWRRLKTEPSGR